MEVSFLSTRLHHIPFHPVSSRLIPNGTGWNGIWCISSVFQENTRKFWLSFVNPPCLCCHIWFLRVTNPPDHPSNLWPSVKWSFPFASVSSLVTSQKLNSGILPGQRIRTEKKRRGTSRLLSHSWPSASTTEFRRSKSSARELSWSQERPERAASFVESKTKPNSKWLWGWWECKSKRHSRTFFVLCRRLTAAWRKSLR